MGMYLHCLNTETGRYQSKGRRARLCDVCNAQEIEDDLHFILQCSKYYDLRKKI